MLKTTLAILKWLLILAVLLAAGIYLFVRFHPTFGGEPDAQSMAKIMSHKYLPPVAAAAATM